MTGEGEYSDSYSGITITTDNVLTATDAHTIDPKCWNWAQAPGHILSNNKKGDDDMRYLYEVILVNPKYDTFHKKCTVAKSETSALMKIYNESPFNKECEGIKWDCIDFDDLKVSCRVLLEWKKEKSLKKAIETIKKAVE